MPVRLKDIARDLGLSVVTISKVVRHHPDISNETRKRVLKRMKELNYQPNLAARSLITGQTWTIGVVVPDLLHPFFAQVAKALSTEVRNDGYSLFLACSDDDPELERREVDQLLARRVDVMLVASTQLTVESFRRIAEQRTPYILIDRQFKGLEANFVGVDDNTVGVLATSHLLEQGCKRVAHIRGPEISTAIGRLEGYRQVLAAHEMTPRRGHIIPIGTSGAHGAEHSGYEATKKLLTNKVQPDGIFCFNDPVALGTMQAIIDAGLRIPEDIAIVGCGNTSYAGILRVPLSSVDQRADLIGKRAADLALQLAHAKALIRPKSVLVPPHLVIRSSSLRLAGSLHKSP